MKKNNQFLTKLLDLEVAGKEAISAPAKWTNEPLLNIKTKVDEVVDFVAPSLISNTKKTGVWWFLVGSPGNGKSAAVGSLVRKLEKEHNATFREPKENGKLGRALSELGENEIPYQMELYEEGNNNYASTLFAQDASVVPNPYDESPDPGEALVNLLDAAASRGQAIVVCANRGIIEKALQQNGVNKKSWYSALRAIRDGKKLDNIKFDSNKSGKNNVFDKVDIIVTPLDEKSIVGDGTFKNLVSRATASQKWDECSDCQSNAMCPFKSNRDWLESSDGLSRFNSIIRYGELMSGQALVFREALALISLLLAGSSRDYQSITPCEWVHQKNDKDSIFSLLSKRIYMVLFSSQSPFGLRLDNSDRKKQLNILTRCIDHLQSSSKNAINALKEQVSTDIGLNRFLSEEGVFAELDPIKENQGKALEQRWNLDPKNIKQLVQEQALICNIEKKCFSIWADCDDAIDDIETDANEFYRELRHWITSITYRLGFFAEGKILFQDELNEYQKALALDNADLSDDDDEFKYRLEESLEEFVFGSEDAKKIRISDVLTVHGAIISGSLTPEIDLEKSKKNRLVTSIGDSSIEISPRSFVWLRRKDKTGMSNKTFPPDVHQDATDIRYKAATSVDYAFIENKVYLDITKSDGSVLKLSRKNGKLRLEEN